VSNWQKEFEIYLKADGVAVRILEKLAKNGLPRQQVLSALEAATKPGLGAGLRKVFDRYLPTASQNKKLAALCLKLQKELERVYGSPMGICFPQSDEMLRLAVDLKSKTAALASTNNSKVFSRFTAKRIWKGFPLEVLYAELCVPKALSWEDLYQLYAVALRARGVLKNPPEPRSLEASHRRFMKRNPRAKELVQWFAKLHSSHYQRHNRHRKKSSFV
jgi:hypothetical protein